MKRLLIILASVLCVFNVEAQFTVPNGTVISGCTVTSVPIGPTGSSPAQALIYYPKGYNLPANANKIYPLYLFNHGSGEGSGQDINEVFNTSLPQLIAQGLDPYNIDPTTHDTIRWIIVAPHCAACNGAYAFPQLQYLVPWMFSNLRVDTTCFWVGGLSAGGSATWSMVMGNGLGSAGAARDTLITRKVVGIMPISNGGYDNSFTVPILRANLDTNLRRGLYVLPTIGSQDQGYNPSGYITYMNECLAQGLPNHFFDSVVAGGIHNSLVWNPPYPLSSRVWSKKVTGALSSNSWDIMWSFRRSAVVTSLQASAGTNQTIVLPINSATISASGSVTPGGTTITAYSWTKTSGPSGGAITSPTSVSTTITGLVQGTYVYDVLVTNSASATSNASVTITVSTAAANPPVVSAGTNQSITSPTSSATLTGSVAAQGTNTITTKAWTQTSGPNSATITSPGSTTTTVTGLIQGTYVFKLTATDNLSQSSNSSVQVTVNPSGGGGGLHVTKVATSEYKCAWLYSDSTVRSFVYTGQVTLTPYIINSRKAVDVAPGFNRVVILDDQGYPWLSNVGLATCVRVDVDTTGAAFNNNGKVYGYFFSYSTITKDSSTIWYWGNDSYNFYGLSGKTNFIQKPVILHAPAGKKWVKLAMGKRFLGLTSAGEIYEWNQNDSNYVQRTFTGTAIDITSAEYDFNVAIIHDYVGGDPTLGTLYWWGTETGFVGDVSARTQPFSVKTLWNQVTSAKEVTANVNTVHYIDSVGDMYGIGDNPNGEVGNGQELVNKYTYPVPYAWSWVKGESYTGAPAQKVGAGTHWKHLYTNGTYAFYLWATDINDSTYNWGRDKSYVGGKGLVNNNEAITPNSLDVLVPTMITPLAHTPASGFNFAYPTCNAGADQSINITSATLTGTAVAAKAGTWGYTIAGYQWTKLSGPTCTITAPTSATTTVTGMSSGVYNFQLVMTDNNTGTVADTIQVTVNTALPVVSAGSNQVVTLPNVPILSGTASGQGGHTISTTVWSRVSGPNTPTITTPNSLSTTISGLIAGTYVFRLTATDNASNIGTADMTLTVNGASTTCGCLVNGVPAKLTNN